MNNIFIASTPYHVILSCGLALENNNHKNHLVIIEDFIKSTILYKNIMDWEDGPFKSVILLEGNFSNNVNRSIKMIEKKNIKFLKKHIKKLNIDNSYVFNDSKPEAQALMHFLKKKSYKNKCFYVEDGSAAYATAKMKSYSSIKILSTKIKNKLFFGFWWKYIQIHGTSKWIDEIKVIFPQYIKKELTNKRVSEISKDNLFMIKNTKWVYNYLNDLNFKLENIENYKVLLIIAHSSFTKKNDQYEIIIKKFVNYLNSIGINMMIKYHPREREKDFLKLRNKNNYILPNSFPIEFLYIINNKNLDVIIGDISTSLITAKWILKNKKIYSLYNYFKDNAPYGLYELFNKLNIKIIRNENDFIANFTRGQLND